MSRYDGSGCEIRKLHKPFGNIFNFNEYRRTWEGSERLVSPRCAITRGKKNSQRGGSRQRQVQGALDQVGRQRAKASEWAAWVGWTGAPVEQRAWAGHCTCSWHSMMKLTSPMDSGHPHFEMPAWLPFLEAVTL